MVSIYHINCYWINLWVASFHLSYNNICSHVQLLPSEQTPAVIHCFGHWQGINSTTKGHSQRGTKKIQEQHCIHRHVGITNKYNKSKTCLFCFSKVILHWTHWIINGKEKIVHLNGAIECVHLWCPARRIKYTTQGRDVNAAANIALSGASIILSADSQPLPPFCCNANHTRYNLLQKNSTQLWHQHWFPMAPLEMSEYG